MQSPILRNNMYVQKKTRVVIKKESVVLRLVDFKDSLQCDNLFHLSRSIIMIILHVFLIIGKTPLRVSPPKLLNWASQIIPIPGDFSVADLGEGNPPLATKFFLISCSFWENLIKSYHAPSPSPPYFTFNIFALPAKILDPPLFLVSNSSQF